MKQYIVHPQTRVRKVGARNFLVRCDYNYTRKDIFEITDDTVKIIDFLKEKKSKKDVLNEFVSDKYPEEAILCLLEYLYENGYVDSWGEKNTVYFSDIVKSDFIPNHTFCTCTFELTPRCNFHCVHCYLGQHRDLPQKLSTNDIKTIIDKLCDNGLLELYLSGGEPLLRADFKEIYLYAKSKGILVEIFTNGYLINDELISVFKLYPPLEIDISLYGASDETYKKITGVDGAYSKIISNIKKCLKNGINVSIKTPVFSPLKNDLQAIKELSEEMDIPYRNAFEINPTIDDQASTYQYQISPEEVARLKKQYSTTYSADLSTLKSNLANPLALAKGKRYLCSTGKCGGFVDYEGNMAPCIELRHRGESILCDLSFLLFIQAIPRSIDIYKDGEIPEGLRDLEELDLAYLWNDVYFSSLDFVSARNLGNTFMEHYRSMYKGKRKSESDKTHIAFVYPKADRPPVRHSVQASRM